MPRRSPGPDATVPPSMLWPLLGSALLVGIMVTGDVIRAYSWQRLRATAHGTGAFGVARSTDEPHGLRRARAAEPGRGRRHSELYSGPRAIARRKRHPRKCGRAGSDLDPAYPLHDARRCSRGVRQKRADETARATGRACDGLCYAGRSALKLRVRRDNRGHWRKADSVERRNPTCHRSCGTLGLWRALQHRKARNFYAVCVLMLTFNVAIYSALPTESAMTAPRAPSGLSPRTVESRTVWCSISEFNCAPNKITMEEIHIHIIMPMAAPSEP